MTCQSDRRDGRTADRSTHPFPQRASPFALDDLLAGTDYPTLTGELHSCLHCVHWLQGHGLDNPSESVGRRFNRGTRVVMLPHDDTHDTRSSE